MAHTNSTTNYALPQFLSTDKPAWLTDVNPAYAAIDTGMHNAQTAADAAQGDATQALSDAAAADGKATTADAKASGAIASLSEAFDPTATYAIGEYVIYNNLLYVCIAAVTTPGPWTGATNWSRTTMDYIATTLNGKTGSSISVSDMDPTSIANVLDNLIPETTTQTVDGINWTIRRTGNFYELWADISIDCSQVTPSTWGSIYVYRNTVGTYVLPVFLTKKLVDVSYSDGSAACGYVNYTADSAENRRTTADIFRPTTTTAVVTVHKYIKGYV